MEKAKRVVWRLLAASVCVMAVSQAVHADSLDEQRNRYAQIKQAWDNKQMDTVQALMPTLKDYPLYPYLEYRQITDDLMNQPTVTVNNFIQANPTLPPARTLKSRFVNELARREDWRGLLAFSPDKPGATEAQCNYYYAKWATGQQEEAWTGAKELWLTGKSQPNACDPLFSAWRASGKQDPLSYGTYSPGDEGRKHPAGYRAGGPDARGLSDHCLCRYQSGKRSQYRADVCAYHRRDRFYPPDGGGGLCQRGA